MPPTCLIGTSGYAYPHWKGPFYPKDARDRELLPFYAARLSTVEINNSFYRLPTKKTFESWAAAVPNDFTFAVKASRYITHLKKLKEPTDSLKKLTDAATGLGEKLGPFLYQLPPNFHFNRERLEGFLEALPKDYRHAIEFRDQTWINDEALGLLKRHGVAFCIYELAGYRTQNEVTAEFVYVRLHGPGDAYQGDYGQEELEGWAGAVEEWLGAGKDVYVYFDNDQAGFAVKDAGELRGMVG